MRKNKLLVDKKNHNYLLRYHFKWREDTQDYFFKNEVITIIFNPKASTFDRYIFLDLWYRLTVKEYRSNIKFYKRRKNYLIKKGLIDESE